MREAMNSCTYLLDKKGRLFAVATGSDACAEHECGTADLQKALCETQTDPSNSERELIKRIRAGKKATYPQVLDRKRITDAGKLQVLTGQSPKGEAYAAVGYYPEPSGRQAVEGALASEIAHIFVGTMKGFWDERSFLIIAHGKAIAGKLLEFAEAMKARDVVFAGTFLKVPSFSGIILARSSLLRPEHRTAIAEAQARWESDIRLKAASQLDDLYAWARQHPEATAPWDAGYFWPVWKNQEPDTEVRYALNPGYRVQADYYGPYTLEEIKAWLLAKTSYPLRPADRRKAS